jgi:putative membrane protein
MLNRATIWAAFAAEGVLLSSNTLVMAQQSGASTSATPTGSAVITVVDAATLQFVQEAASDGLMEVKLGQMAQQKASSNAVKQFGERMVQDHTLANNELMGLASQKGITPPTNLMPQHQEMVDKLSMLSGEQFDSEYMTAMIQDHTKGVQDFERQAQTGVDPDIRGFATKTLAVLREHLKMAQDIAAQQGVGGR